MNMHGDGYKMKGRRIALHVLAGMAMAVVFGVLFGYFVMLLWNNLLPDIFGLKQITFWQGIGLVILARLLFGSHGFHKHGHCQGRFQHHKDGHSFCCNSDNNDTRKDWWETEGKVAFQQYLKNTKLE